MFSSFLSFSRTFIIETICPYDFIESLCFHSIKVVSIYTLSDLGYSSNLIGSLSRANAALFTRYRVDNALSHKTKQNGRRKLAFR